MINILRVIPYVILWGYGTFCVHFALFEDGTSYEKLMVLGMFIVINTLHTISEYTWSDE